MRKHVLAHFLVMGAQKRVDIEVPFAKLTTHGAQLVNNLFFSQCKHASDNRGDEVNISAILADANAGEVQSEEIVTPTPAPDIKSAPLQSGDAGSENPDLVDADGIIRDLSGVVGKTSKMHSARF